MSTFLQLTFAGLNVGAVYMLIALGMVTVYQVARVENLAQSAFVVYGALVFISLHDDIGLPLPVAIVLSLLACSLIAALLSVLVLNRFARRGHTGPVVITLGVAILLGEIARQVWGLNDRSAAPYLSSKPFHVLGATVLPHAVLVWVGTAVLVIGAYVIFERTMVGKALRAAAQDFEGARLVGISPRRMQFLGFQVAGFLGGAGGILLAPLLPLGWTSIFPLVLIGVMGAIGGRWQYVPAAAASVAIGLAASYAGGFGSTSWQDIYVYGAFLVILFLAQEEAKSMRLRVRFPRNRQQQPHASALPGVAESHE